MLIKPPCSNEQTEPKKKELKKVEVDFEKYPRPEGSLPGTLAYERPDLLEEWDYEKNNELELDPLKLTYKSAKKAWWKCKTCNYKWHARIYNRTNNIGCPACANQVVTSTNNLAYKFPSLAEEWDYEKNDITPNEVTAYSNKKVWWKCRACGYEWYAQIHSRTGTHKTGCPNCAKSTQTSFPEQAIYFYIHKYFEDAINTYKDLGFELDIYIPSKNIAIEYDGLNWHTDKLLNDQRKTNNCIQKGTKLIRIRELGLSNIANCIIINVKPNPSYEDLDMCIKHILKKYLGVEQLEVNINHDLSAIKSQIEQKTLDNSLATLYSEIAEEFMSEKNGITPDKVSAHSNNKYWWKCKICNYEYNTRISSRTSERDHIGCPICNKSAHLITENRTLAKLYPELLSEYSSENTISSDKIAAVSGKEVYWTCNNCGKLYKKRLASRTTQGIGCPHCYAGRHPEFRTQRRYIDEQGKLVIEQK